MKKSKFFIALSTFITLHFQLLTHNTQAQVGFNPAVYFSAGSGPTSIISADFNGDSKIDLAIARNDSTVLLLLGNGLGNFSIADSFKVGKGPLSIISADFNGDGKADLATANQASYNVSVLLGNGAGSFGTATNFAAGSFPNSIISADFNGDGKPDLAVVNQVSNNVSILLGKGSGGFGSTTNFAVGANPSSIICADFNGDGKTDLAVTNQGSNNVSILLGSGLGGFGSATNFTVGSGPNSIISADFNGDSKADLAIVNFNDNNVSIFLGNGTGGFGTANNFSVGNSPFSIVSADFNGDGKADLAVTNGSSNVSVSVLKGDGTGSFGDLVQITAGYMYSSEIISADFNGDGKADLAATNFYGLGAFVLLNNPFAAIPVTPPICSVTVDSTHTHNIVVWEKTNLNMAAMDSFVVYREMTTNNYQPIGFVLYDSMSSFDDFGANPAATGYKYKLKSKSAQGVEAFLFSDYHNTMYLTSNGANFSWTPYQIEGNTAPVSAYYIYRDNNSTGNFQNVDNTTGNQTGYTDVNYSSYPNASYYIEAVMTAGSCSPARSGFGTSRSNVKYIGSNGLQQLNTLTTINIYPNPTGNTLNINNITCKTKLRLYDVVGKLVIEKEVENNTTINISQLAKGIYTLLAESKTGRAFNKVLINH